MIDHIYRAWVKPEQRMITSDWEYTKVLLKYVNDDKNGNRDEIGFLKDFDGKALDFQLRSSKKDINNEFIFDGDIVYSRIHLTSLKVQFNGCSFVLLNRNDNVICDLAAIES